MAANLEVLERTLGLSAPELIGRYLNFAQGIVLYAIIHGAKLPRWADGQNVPPSKGENAPTAKG
jgi:hypothetical protein